ncbi:Predicted dithiol-disulfide isomerase, DsbA family [Fontibacillus panacisegetis]|uniref:Predicted dithiol-disulfide isomerase, DsbA family n=1 Tax=Fontibacillus panacisegetis TaxID=670482 RepID=A0A1G7N7M5_9BACL|nr:Predicted dithiol-disulfide isomerase, DsbA family [Fontibacillus panacisegetis]
MIVLVIIIACTIIVYTRRFKTICIFETEGQGQSLNNENMFCDLETGVCGVNGEDELEVIDLTRSNRKITLYYVTDPICSHCWALEPVLNRFIKQYASYFKLQIVMGGLLPGWHGFADKSNGIQKPSDVAQHWQEVGEHSRMPIDGTLWHDHPILSSYPPSRVFKVIQEKHEGKENEFLRRAREAVFVFNRNIGEDEVLIDLVHQMGLDGEKIVAESGLESAQNRLEQDFELSSSLGVKGFPTVIMVNEENKGVKIVGAQPLQTYVEGLKQILPERVNPDDVPNLLEWLEEGHPLFSKEIEMMYDLEQNEVLAFVQSELPQDSYRIYHILGEMYIESVKKERG